MSGGAGVMGIRTVLAIRLLAVAVGSAVLVALTYAAVAEPPVWPATVPWLFLPTGLVAAGVPVLLVFGVGRMSGTALAAWAVVGAAVLAVLGYANVVRAGPSETDLSQAMYSFQFTVALAAAFFVAQVLVTDMAATRRVLPPYALHFATGWKQGVQAAVAVAFALLFWGVLGLGTALFRTIGIGVFGRVLSEPWFFIPAGALALALAVHATDVQPALLNGIRVLLLGLLSWLLPLLAGFVLAFLGTLAVTGLEPLWDTHFAAALLLGTAGALVVLVNSAYGDGDGWAGSRVRRWSIAVAGLELPVLAGLGAVALWLRAAQYGWTVTRVFGAAATVLLAAYAVGYAAAVVLRRGRVLEVSNFAAAWLGLALVAVLFTPVADPARLATASQVDRLHRGLVTPDAFDYRLLRRDGARWGAAALDALGRDADPRIAEAARAAVAATGSETVDAGEPATAANGAVLDPASLRGRVTVRPEGRSFPAELLQAEFGGDRDGPPDCFKPGYGTCVLRFAVVREGGPEAVLLMDGSSADVFEQDRPGHWRKTGALIGRVECTVVQDALGAGRFSTVPDSGPGLRVGDLVLPIGPAATRCPPHR